MPKDSGSPVISSLWLAWAFFQHGGLKLGRLQEKRIKPPGRFCLLKVQPWELYNIIVALSWLEQIIESAQILQRGNGLPSSGRKDKEFVAILTHLTPSENVGGDFFVLRYEEHLAWHLANYVKLCFTKGSCCESRDTGLLLCRSWAALTANEDIQFSD